MQKAEIEKSQSSFFDDGEEALAQHTVTSVEQSRTCQDRYERKEMFASEVLQVWRTESSFVANSRENVMCKMHGCQSVKSAEGSTQNKVQNFPG